MNVTINPQRIGVSVDNPDMGVRTASPVARYVVEPYIKAEETEDGVIITCTDPDGTTTGEVYNGTDGTDGVSPEVTVDSITGGHRVTITDAESEHTFDVMDGIDGKDGKDGKDGATGATPDLYTTAVGLAAGENPYAHVSGTIEQPLITFGIPAGQAGKDGKDGTDGTDGTDGVSPDVTIASITGGHSVTITDADHPTGQTFNVMDGAEGPAGTTDYNDLENKPFIPSTASDVGALPDTTAVDKVAQTHTDPTNYTYWRPIPIGASAVSSEDAAFSTATDAVRTFDNIRVQPSTGTIKATNFKGNLTGNVTGTASGNLKSGDNVSALTNDAGYLTLADLPVWNGGVE